MFIFYVVPTELKKGVITFFYKHSVPMGLKTPPICVNLRKNAVFSLVGGVFNPDLRGKIHKSKSTSEARVASVGVENPSHKRFYFLN